jgi:hypothetical protein
MLRQPVCAYRRVLLYVLFVCPCSHTRARVDVGLASCRTPSPFLLCCSQVRSILGNVRPDRQVLMFSATFRKRVEGLARDAVRNPVRITVGVVGQSNENVSQKVSGACSV